MCMKAEIKSPWGRVTVDLHAPIDISIPLRSGKENVNAWYVGPVEIEPVRGDGFVGAVKEGGSVNFRNVAFNPHGNGTHTECVGHINPDVSAVQDSLNLFWFTAVLMTINPEKREQKKEFQEIGDRVILFSPAQKKHLQETRPEALVIRTLPNIHQKINAHYSNTNPPYLDHEAALFLRNVGVKHLLIDLPSVDREHDGGRLLAHRAFWNYPDQPRKDCTITELIYVPDTVPDGKYMLNLQMASLVNDASPSKPCLHALEQK